MLSMRLNSKGESKSKGRTIYRGDHSHTLSMHLKTDFEVSPETLRNHCRQGNSKIDKFR